MKNSQFTQPTINLLFIGESYLGGMAGSKRIQNIINALLPTNKYRISNLVIHNPNELLPVQLSGNKNLVTFQILFYSLKNPFSLLSFYLQAFKFIRSQRRQECKNILYCYDTPTFINFALIRYARRKGYKVVVDIVEDYALSMQSLGFKQRFMHKRQVRLLEKMNGYANGAIAISKYLYDKLKDKTKELIPVFHLPVTVNFSNFPVTSKKETRSKKLFYGGSFGEKDGLLYLLQAFEKVALTNPDLELILTGKPPKAGMQPVTDFIKNSKSGDRIRQMGYLDDQAYYAEMNKSDVFCMSRVSSGYAGAGFPFKLGEMLATASPVISTKVSNVSDYLTNKQNALLVNPDSADEIADAIRFILEHPEEAGQIGKAGRATAEKYFDTEVYVEPLEKFFLSV